MLEEIRSAGNNWVPGFDYTGLVLHESCCIRFKADDLRKIEGLLQRELGEGNRWVAINAANEGYDITSGMQFFKDENEVARLCSEDLGEFSLYVGWEISLLANSISNLRLQPEQYEKSYSLLDYHGNTDMLTLHFNKVEPGIKNLSLQNNRFMNEQNLEYLKGNLKYAGFGEKLYPELEDKIKQGVPEFALNIKTQFEGKQFEANLHFKRGDQFEMYFFNKYDAQLTRADSSTAEQTFYMDKGKGYTAKEAFNLLDGRAVHKEQANKDGDPYLAWRRIDFDNKTEKGNYEYKQFHQNFGYDVGAALAKHDFKELADPKQPEWIQRSLERGNLHQVTGPNDQKLFISANPESGKTNKLNVVDGNGKEVTTTLKETTVDKGLFAKAEVKAKSKGTNEDDLLPKHDKKKSRGKSKGEEEDLLPKKRVGKGKGLHV